jgi:cytochrome c oxidase cbb3-type subunit 1
MMEAITSAKGETLISYGLVKAHLAAAVVSFLVSLAGGFFYSLVFLQGYPFEGISWLSPGRVRMVHTNLIAYGFLFNAFLGGLTWSVPRLTGIPLVSEKLGWTIFWAWQLIVASTFAGILGGQAQAVEWGETPIWVDPLVVAGAVLVAIRFFPSIFRSRERGLYVSLWYFTAGLVWVALTYLMGNYLPQFFLPGASGAAVTGLFIHDLVGLFVTPMGWGLMYYFVPVILRKPIFSHGLSLIGFWGLAFFYPLNGVHHFLYSPIPMYAQYGAVVSTVAVEIVVTTVIVNFFMTLRGRGDALRYNLPIRWFFTGMVFYSITCLQCAYQTTLEAQKIIHFSDWVVGHAHLVMFGVFGFWVNGMIAYLWPKLYRRGWFSERWNSLAYWLIAVGMLVMFIDLVAAGLLQGFLWKGLSSWENSIAFSVPFWWVRTGAGTMIIAGQTLFFLNMWWTARVAAMAAGAPGSVMPAGLDSKL